VGGSPEANSQVGQETIVTQMYDEEVEFERRLQALERDSVKAARFTYIDATIRHYESADEVLSRLNNHAGFWVWMIDALQVAQVITVSRMFDKRQDTDTILGLLAWAETYHPMFSPQRLKERKVKSGLTLADAENYVAGKPTIPRSAWQSLKAATAERQTLYQEQIKPLRHEIFAHSGQLTHDERAQLFTKARVRTLEELSVFPLRTSRAIWECYHNGTMPILEDVPSLYSEVRAAMPPPEYVSWEHLHAAREASAFLDWLKAAPMSLDR
jgi:hypothetical protein